MSQIILPGLCYSHGGAVILIVPFIKNLHGIDDYNNDGGEELFTKMHRVRMRHR